MEDLRDGDVILRAAVSACLVLDLSRMQTHTMNRFFQAAARMYRGLLALKGGINGHDTANRSSAFTGL